MKSIQTVSAPVELPRELSSALGVVSFALLTALASQIKIFLPGNPVPMTLQTAVVLSAGLFLGAKRGALSQALYISLGAIGIPFFSFATGAAALMGPTGGYLFGFILAAAATGVCAKYCRDSIIKTWIITFLSSFIILGFGTLQLKLLLNLSWTQAFAMGVAPFLLGDVLKVTLSSIVFRLRWF